MEKDDLVHDMEAVSPRSFEDGLPVSQDRILKFELQLYKLKDSEYLLDVQVHTLLSLPCTAITFRGLLLQHKHSNMLEVQTSSAIGGVHCRLSDANMGQAGIQLSER